MNVQFLEGKWNGFYTYKENYSKKVLESKTSFEIVFSLNNGSLTGSCLEASDDQSIITDVIFESNSIKFIKQYPRLHLIDDDGNTTIDKSSRHPLINYIGSFDPTNNSFSGTWSMEFIQLIDDTIYKHTMTGKWFMKKSIVS